MFNYGPSYIKDATGCKFVTGFENFIHKKPEYPPAGWQSEKHGLATLDRATGIVNLR